MTSNRPLVTHRKGLKDRYGPWALVAGASEGIGAEFARQLAESGLHLILVDKQEEQLVHLAEKIAAIHDVETRPVVLDLCRSDMAERVEEAAGDLEVGLLVYNAALSIIGSFLDQPLERHLATIDLNCRGPLILSHILGGKMAARGRGGVIFMSSMSGLRGSALVAGYAATKAFNLVLAEGLWYELRAHGVDILACLAGPTRTPSYLASNPAPGALSERLITEPEQVVGEALAALGKQPSHIPGFLNRVASFVMGRLLSRRRAITIVGNTMRNMYGDGTRAI